MVVVIHILYKSNFPVTKIVCFLSFNLLKNSVIDRKHTFLSLLSKLHISLYPYFSAVISALIPSPFFCSMLQPAKQRHLKHSTDTLKPL